MGNLSFKLNSESQELIWLGLSTIIILFPNVVGIILVILLSLWMIWQNRSDLREIIRGSGWFGIFIVYSAITSLTSRNYIGFLVSLVYIIYLAFFAHYRTVITAKTYLRLLKLIVFASIFVNLVAYGQYLTYVYNNGYDIFYVFKYHNIQIRPAGTFFNANVFGVFCIFAILIALFLLLKTTSKKRKVYYFVVIAINLIGMTLTGSRMIWPALLASLFVTLFIYNRKLGIGILLLGLIGGIIILRFPEIYPRFSSLAYGFQDRLKIWEAGFELFKLNPIFGSGPLTYRNSFYLVSDLYKLHTHSLFLELLSSYGIVGCIILCLAVKDYFVQFFRDLINPETRQVAALIASFLTVVLVHGMFDFAVFNFQLSYLILIVALPPSNVLEDVVKLDEKTNFITRNDSP